MSVITNYYHYCHFYMLPMRQRLALAWASTFPGCRRQAALLYKWTFCSSTVSTDCTIPVMQREIKWLCPAGQHSSRSFGPSPAFQVNSIIITCFFSLLPLLLLIKPSYLHSLLPCHYNIITYYWGNNVSIITHYYFCFTLLFLIISNLLHLLLHYYNLLLPSHYYLLL